MNKIFQNSGILRVGLLKGILLLYGVNVFSYTVEWIYTHDISSWDAGFHVEVGEDGYVYAAGIVYPSSNNGYDIELLKLSSNGSLIWSYRHNGSLSINDRPNDMIIGPDGNIYILNDQSGHKLNVICIDPLGNKLWEYLGPKGYGYSICYGDDGNLYISAGVPTPSDSDYTHYTVISLNTSGQERWIWQSDDRGNAYDIIYGSDDNIYTCGFIVGYGNEFCVFSHTTNGTLRWSYTLPSSNSYSESIAWNLVEGENNNLYIVGFRDYFFGGTNGRFTVLSLASNGSFRWKYEYEGAADEDDWDVPHSYVDKKGGFDGAHDIVLGEDGNLYVVGNTYNSTASWPLIRDVVLFSFTPQGNMRWIYTFPGPENFSQFKGFRIIKGETGKLYLAVKGKGGKNSGALTVISIDSNSGVEEWVYRKDGSREGREDDAKDIVYSSDGKIYVVGTLNNMGAGNDFVVIKISP